MPMSYHSQRNWANFEALKEPGDAEQTIIRALPMLVPENLLQRVAERKRIKQGILDEADEERFFQKTLYLPYLDFTYQYHAEKGLFFSKRFSFSRGVVQTRGRSITLALREVDIDFYPELAALAPLMIEIRSPLDSVVEGVDSTALVRERLEELKEMLSNYDDQLLELAKHYDSMPETDPMRQEIKDNIDHLRRTRESRWRMFADGLKLPSKMDLETIEFLEGSLFYMPYFIVRFVRGGESRFLVWDREGKPNESIADELNKNGKFRDLILSHATI
jgi:hypothetical protein